MLLQLRILFSWLRDVWLIISITFAMLLFIEMVLSIVFHYRTHSPTYDYRCTADTYQGSDWPRQYFIEHTESGNCRWESYVYWRRKPYQGEYINVDSQGIRKTWYSNVVDSNNRITVFMLGGSTMWGTGARDNFTIPSIVAQKLTEKGINVKVVNYGESGYVSTQEVIQLIRELQKGNTPDLVIFYDGVNDTYAAYQQPSAGIPQNEFNRTIEFNSSQTIIRMNLLMSLLNNSSTMRFVDGVYRKLSGSMLSSNTVNNQRQPGNESLARNDEALAKEVVEVYQNNVKIVKYLAEQYKFKVLFYWQPTIFQKRYLTKYEQGEKERYLQIQPFFESTFSFLRAHNLARNNEPLVYDLSLIFSGVRKPLFIDWCHLGEEGNTLIADRLVVDALSSIHAE